MSFSLSISPNHTGNLNTGASAKWLKRLREMAETLTEL